MSRQEEPIFDLFYMECVFFNLMVLVAVAAFLLGLIDTPERTFDDAAITYWHAAGCGVLWLFVRFVRLA